MKKFKLTKIIASTLVATSLLALDPIGASAAWENTMANTRYNKDNGWRYSDGGSYVTGWQQIDGKWYYFDSAGSMKHDTYVNGYYLNSSGEWKDVTISGNFKFDKSAGAIVGYTGADAKVVIPSEIDGIKVTRIGGKAFVGCSSFTSITIPNSVTSIGKFAFNNCDKLITVDIPDSVNNIEYGAFYSCSALKSVIIPKSVTSIEAMAFSECINLTSLIISNGVTSIGGSAFAYCNLKSSVIIPNSVTSLGYDVFRGNRDLTSVTIPDSVNSIEGHIFWECDNAVFYVESENMKELLTDSVTNKSKIIVNGQPTLSEWKHDSTGWWYTEGNSYATGWRLINGKWYYFNNNGYMAQDTTIDGYKLGFDGARMVTT